MEEEPQSQSELKSKILNAELDILGEERINYKLTLRKKKYNDILSKKRIYPKNVNSSYELFISKLKLPPNYKIIFSKEEDLINTALQSMKSDDVTIVKYGVCLIKTYLWNFLDDENVLNNLNLNFVSDMLNLLEKWGAKKELQIIYNVLHILTNYSYKNENKLITKILLSSKGYKIWELCFDFQDYEIMSQMMWMLHNATYKDSESSYNLIKSNFFRNKIFSFYSSETIIKHMHEKNPENIFYLIIQSGLGLFSNLISIQYPSSYDNLDKKKLSYTVFDLILKYSQSTSDKIYHSCIYAICLAVDEDYDLVNRIDGNNIGVNILYDILNKKFFSNENCVLHANRILGNYISVKSGLSEEFFNKCIQYEFDIFFGINLSIAVKETYWVLSNILSDYNKAGFIICHNEPFINKTMEKYRNPVELNDINEIAYFFNCLINKCGVENFINLIGKGYLDLTLNYSKMTFNHVRTLITILQLIESSLDIGESFKDNFNGKNKVKEKCDEYGLKEVLEKYEDTENQNLFNIIDEIKNIYYNE